jgi:hypothetical protein
LKSFAGFLTEKRGLVLCSLHRQAGLNVLTQQEMSGMKLKAQIILTASLFVASGCGDSAPPSQPVLNDSEVLATFVDDFVSQYEFEKSTDLSVASFAKELQQTKSYLARLHDIDTSTLTTDEEIDWQFAKSILRGKEITQESLQSWKRDPRVYMQYRSIGRVIGRPGDAGEKADELLEILKAIPARLANGQNNLEVYIPRFQELSLFMAEGAISLFDNDIPAFADSVPDRREDLLGAGNDARIALEAFIDFLNAGLTEKPPGQWAIGKENYDALLKDQYLLSYDSDELFEFGLREFERTVGELEELAREIDPNKTWKEIFV